jgi:hypothetical protein
MFSRVIATPAKKSMAVKRNFATMIAKYVAKVPGALSNSADQDPFVLDFFFFFFALLLLFCFFGQKEEIDNSHA